MNEFILVHPYLFTFQVGIITLAAASIAESLAKKETNNVREVHHHYYPNKEEQQ